MSLGEGMNWRQWWSMVKAGGRGPWGWIPALLLSVISGKWVHFSEPQFPLPESEDMRGLVWNPHNHSWYLTHSEHAAGCGCDYKDEASGGWKTKRVQGGCPESATGSFHTQDDESPFLPAIIWGRVEYSRRWAVPWVCPSPLVAHRSPDMWHHSQDEIMEPKCWDERKWISACLFLSNSWTQHLARFLLKQTGPWLQALAM